VNVLGETILSSPVNAGSGNIDTRGLARGVYTIRVVGEGARPGAVSRRYGNSRFGLPKAFCW
jgi:hypothetical protein